MLHRMKSGRNGRIHSRRRILALTAMAVAATVIRAVNIQADTTATWTGANSSSNSFWNDTANWNPATVPINGTPSGTTYDVIINVSVGSNSHADLSGFSPTIGNLVLATGDNIYNSGGTTETLTIDPSTMGSPAGSVINGDIGSTGSQIVLNFGNGNASSVTSTISGALTGNLALIIDQPSGVVTLSNTSNTYTGGTTLTGGTLSISSDSNLGASISGLLFNGGTLETTAAINSSRSMTVGTAGGTINTDSQTDIFNGTITGSGSMLFNGGGIAQLHGDSTGYSGPVTIDAPTTVIFYNSGSLGTGQVTLGSGGGTLQAGATGVTLPNAIALSDALNSGTPDIYSTGSASYSDTLSGNITGSGGLEFTGGGEVILTGSNNTYSGGTLIQDGTTVGVGNNSVLGTGPVTIANTTGEILYTAANMTITNPLTLNGNGIIDGGGFSTALSPEIFGGTITDTTGATLTIQDGLVALQNNNNYLNFTTGTLVVGNGNTSPGSTLEFSSTSASPSIATTLPAANVGVWLNDGELLFTSNVTGDQSSVTIGNNITLSSTNTPTVNVMDAGDSVFSETNTLTLSSNIINTFAGNTLILQDGNFIINGFANNTNFSRGALQIGNGSGSAQTSAEFVGVGAIPGSQVGLALNFGTFQFGANGMNVVNDMALVNTDFVDIHGRTGAEISGSLSGSGALTLENSVLPGGGTLTLSGNNSSFTGT
ncbi:MAG: hypothetical protein M0Z50_11985, partial [Planctomycetia bacterium]|nr:hypothetical protein [Planctomycetia bacterium]